MKSMLTTHVAIAALLGTAGAEVLDIRATKQPIDGFGTSLCWWAFGVGGWSNDTAFEHYMDQFFGDPEATGGLGLNQVRYNIGGSDVAAGDAHFLRAGGFAQTYLPKPGTAYDWTVDATQRRVLAAAKKRGVQYVQAFANSPPWWMTVSGSVTGNHDGTKDNLKPSQFEAFATYLAAVCQHFHTSFNVTFDTVTPLNEPVASWWKYGNGQEGCHFDHSSQSRIIGLTGKALKSMGLSQIGVSGAEENWVDDTVGSVSAYTAEDLEQLTLVTTHTYNGRPGQRQALSRFAAAHGKRLWASEYGDGDVSGVTLAKRITLDLNEGNFSVWTLWQVSDLDNSLTTSSGWGLTAATYCGCEHGESCLCKPPPAQCALLKDTWKPQWTHDPHDACQQWSVNKQWGALKGGQTLAEACKGDFGRNSCALTCCEALPPAPASAPASAPAPAHHRRTEESAPGSAEGAFALRKSFFAYKQFTAHIRPGSTILAQPRSAAAAAEAEEEDGGGEPALLAALDPHGRPVLVYTNDRDQSVAITKQLLGLASAAGSRLAQATALCAAVHVTSAEHNSERIGEQRLVQGSGGGASGGGDKEEEEEEEGAMADTLQAMLLPQSVTTFTVDACSE
jgi:O-glycosyl hydrolase